VKIETDNFLVLTVPTAELQTFIFNYADDEKAFALKEGEELRRVK
jgi:hypothetical protein